MLLGAIFLSITGEAQARYDDAVRLAIGEWAPFTGRTLPGGGGLARLVDAAFAEAGYDVEFEFMPWTRAFERVRQGHYDGSPGWRPTRERERDMVFSGPLVETKAVLVHLLDTPLRWTQIDDLGRYRLGVLKGYSYGDDFDSARRQGSLRLDVSHDLSANIRKLLVGRLDGLVASRREVRYMISRTLSPDTRERLVEHPQPIHTGFVHLMFSRALPGDRSSTLMSAFERGLRTLETSGFRERILGF